MLYKAERSLALDSKRWLAGQPIGKLVSPAQATTLPVMADDEGRFPIEEGEAFFGVNDFGDIVTDIFVFSIDAELALTTYCGATRTS